MRFEGEPRVNFEQFQQLMLSHKNPVVLLEGTRDLPDSDRPKLVALAQFLATQFPHVVFRTGNASGSDEAFAAGVCARRQRFTRSSYSALSSVVGFPQCSAAYYSNRVRRG